ncbi:MAG: molecular chaperone HtpG [Methylococcales bacterium]
MSDTSAKQDMEFQTEVNQLLHLMIHSLYSNKEIFLRELISNGSDACDKLRFEAIADDSLYEGDSELRIEVEYEKDTHTVTIRDNGIGMSRDEVIDNIGTIAKSGTQEFLKKLTGDQTKDANLIGQFGVGFYSSFIVADKVTLITRRAGVDKSEGVQWESTGESGYSLETIEKDTHGTEITLHLKDDEKEFADSWRLRNIISKYSDHIPLPINMHKADDDGKPTDEWEVVNKASALWTRSKNEIKDDEYKEFYKHISHDWQEPLAWGHNRVEGNLEYISLLYLPSKAPFDLYDQNQQHGIKLYVQRVFIMDDADTLMPRYLRFVRGVIDSSDLPLNISREILQGNSTIDSMRKASVKRVLKLLADLAKKDTEKYQNFWNEFGKAIKEGPAEDFANKEQIAKLLRFSSTETDSEVQNVSLEDYVARMKEGQDKVYYVTAETFAAAKNSPHMEIFRKKGIEVLLLTDRVDEWLVSGLTDFDGKQLQSIAKGELDLGSLDDEDDKAELEKAAEDAKDIIDKLKEVLGDKVEEVRVSNRLTSSASCIVLNEQDMALYMQNMLKQAGQEMPSSKPALEINATHPLVERMKGQLDSDQFGDWASILFDQAILAEGGQLEDPAGFVHKLNELMLDMA